MSYIGLEVNPAVDLETEVEQAFKEGYNFIVTPLVHPFFERQLVYSEDPLLKSGTLPLTRSDLILPDATWRRAVVGLTSEWIKLESADETIQDNMAKALRQDIAWASYLNLSVCILPYPPCHRNTEYAGTVCSILNSSELELWVQIPLISYQTLVRLEDSHGNLEDELFDFSGWKDWNALRLHCHYSNRLGVIIELTNHLPPPKRFYQIIARWLSEPLKAILIPTSLFLCNEDSELFLPEEYIHLLQYASQYQISVIVRGSRISQNGQNSLEKYIAFLSKCLSESKKQPLKNLIYREHLDLLEIPLQPLKHHLSSSIYSVFEQDKAKYRKYYQATVAALRDLASLRNIDEKRPIVVAILGAGRGPIMDAALKAATKLKILTQTNFYAVEKNPYAFTTLQNKRKTDASWKNVKIVHADLREWKIPIEADLIISELLGSFGDNEGSPECLFEAQKLLCPTGICIPQYYESFLAPVSTPKLWSQLSHSPNSAIDLQKCYVVNFHAYLMTSPPQSCFSFSHPAPDDVHSKRLSRSSTFVFVASTSSVLHGFAGYFRAQLYREHWIDIDPTNDSQEITSWFPMYFPICQPLTLEENQAFRVHFWRRTNCNKVWYEWCISEPIATPIHNINGHAFSIDTS